MERAYLDKASQHALTHNLFTALMMIQGKFKDRLPDLKPFFKDIKDEVAHCAKTGKFEVNPIINQLTSAGLTYHMCTPINNVLMTSIGTFTNAEPHI